MSAKRKREREREPSVWVLERRYPDGEWRVPLHLASCRPVSVSSDDLLRAWWSTLQTPGYRAAEYRRVPKRRARRKP